MTDYVRVKVAEYPAGVHDAAALLNMPGGPEAFGAMIRNARPGPSWMIANLGTIEDVTDYDLATVEGQVAACEDMVDTLLRQPPIARTVYVRELAEKLGASERDIRLSLNAVVKERAAYYERHPDERPKPTPVWERDAL